MKQLIKLIYANALCLKDFIELNDGIKNHCEQVVKEYGGPLATSKRIRSE